MRVDLGPEYVAVVGGGEISPSALPVILGASSVVAADSGAQYLKDNGIIPWVLVGDFDSCDPGVVSWMDESGSRVITLPRDKDKTDTEVALDMACDEGFKQAVLVGGLGGDRLEHSLANLSLIEAYAERGLDVVIFHRDTVIFGLLGRGEGAVERRFRGRRGDWVSAFPVTREVRGVTTGGLRFPLSGATLVRGTTFGTSNEMTAKSATISVTEGFLLVVVTGGSPTVT
ncbi:MAG: thiamine diphosphokinase [Bacillota bacterium]